MESEGTPTTSTSEGDSTAAGAADSGASADGGTGGTQAAVGGDAIAQREAAQAEVRSLQSARDKLRAEIATLEAQRGSTGSTSTPDNAPQSDPEVSALRASVGNLEKMLRRQAVEPEAERLKADDKFASVASLRPDLFDSLDSYESPAALRAAVEAEAERLNPLVSALVEKEREAILAEVSSKYGIRIAPAAPAEGGETPAGDPDITSLAGMSLKDFDPEVARRALRSS